MMKTNVIENIVPIIVELKNLLEKQHSPLLRHLMMYLKELMKDYKEEVNGIYYNCHHPDMIWLIW